VLADYEGLVREAGYEPGAVLPSTLAALAGLNEDAGPSLMVNASRESVTTAIVRDGILLLHRTIFLATGFLPTGDVSAGSVVTAVAPAAPADDVARRASAEEAAHESSRDTSIAAIAARFAAMEGQTTPAPRAPEAPQVTRVGSALASSMAVQAATAATVATEDARAVRNTTSSAEEIVQAVNVAAAYFEDTLEAAPQVILSAGPLGAETLARMLGGRWQRVEEMVTGSGSEVPAGWLAGVQGALKS